MKEICGEEIKIEDEKPELSKIIEEVPVFAERVEEQVEEKKDEMITVKDKIQTKKETKLSPSSKTSKDSTLEEEPKEELEETDDLKIAFDKYESALSTRKFIHGSNLTNLDRDAYEFLKPVSDNFDSETHPNLFAYFNILNQFSNQAMDQWEQVDLDFFGDIFGDDDKDAEDFFTKNNEK